MVDAEKRSQKNATVSRLTLFVLTLNEHLFIFQVFSLIFPRSLRCKGKTGKRKLADVTVKGAYWVDGELQITNAMTDMKCII